MRTYRNIEAQELQIEKVVCNQCKKQLKVEEGILREGCFHTEYEFDYFSKKDGYIYSFDLCEECFDAWIKGFKEPVRISETKEFL